MKHTALQRGFTLLETLIALFIFSLALVLLTTISSRGIAVANNAISQTTAQFLAQEGIEMVESVRDDNFLAVGTPWLSGLVGAGEPCDGTPCYADPVQAGGGRLQFFSCASGACPTLSITNNGVYGYTGDPTPFTRSIYLTDVQPDDYATIRSVVTWQRNGVPYSVEAQKQIFHWFQNI